ncbi:MAG: acetyltransferase [Candidatus Peribacteraceae bacterium]|jgi:sugar O-acyltransferase (sialic acid O-acetyltransferase NeuD family)
MRSLVILGTGGQSIDILDTVLELNRIEPVYEVLGFLDDDVSLHGSSVFNVPVLGSLQHAKEMNADVLFVNGIGSPATFFRKAEIISGLGLPRERFATIIHPTASVSRLSKIGSGTVVLQHATVAAQADVGDHVMILPGVVISHHDVIGDYCTIAGGVNISGRVKISSSVYIGTNACIREDVTIGSGSLIGMGAVVRHDVSEGQIVAGNPAVILPSPRLPS